MTDPGLYRFLLRVLLWLPVCFAGWYFLSLVLVIPITAALNLTLPALLPEAVAVLEQREHLLEVVTRLTPAQVGAEGGAGLVTFTVNPLVYGYSLPLLVALILATPIPREGRERRIALGFLLLLPVQIFGVATDILKTLVFSLGPVAAAKAGIQGWEIEAVALAYQFGYLILPAISPIILWLYLHRAYVALLVPRLSSR